MDFHKLAKESIKAQEDEIINNKGICDGNYDYLKKSPSVYSCNCKVPSFGVPHKIVQEKDYLSFEIRRMSEEELSKFEGEASALLLKQIKKISTLDLIKCVK